MASLGLVANSFLIATKMEEREVGKRRTYFWVLK